MQAILEFITSLPNRIGKAFTTSAEQLLIIGLSGVLVGLLVGFLIGKVPSIQLSKGGALTALSISRGGKPIVIETGINGGNQLKPCAEREYSGDECRYFVKEINGEFKLFEKENGKESEVSKDRIKTEQVIYSVTFTGSHCRLWYFSGGVYKRSVFCHPEL